MTDWHTYLDALRTEALNEAFRGCPPKAFTNALELGAGSGFQSRLLIAYAEHLLATDLNADRLENVPTPGIEYKICDAERVDEYVPAASFDLIFSSNLFEHLPSPPKALAAIKKVMRPDGIVILTMPNSTWKFFSLLGFYPNAVRLVWRAAKGGRMRSLWKKYILRDPESQAARLTGNNVKTEKREASRAGIFWPEPHGAYPSHLAEFKEYRKARWLALFKQTGFEVITVRKGALSSGYGFGLDWIRNILKSAGVTGEFIYVLKRAGANPPQERYWLDGGVAR